MSDICTALEEVLILSLPSVFTSERKNSVNVQRYRDIIKPLKLAWGDL